MKYKGKCVALLIVIVTVIFSIFPGRLTFVIDSLTKEQCIKFSVLELSSYLDFRFFKLIKFKLIKASKDKIAIQLGKWHTSKEANNLGIEVTSNHISSWNSAMNITPFYFILLCRKTWLTRDIVKGKDLLLQYKRIWTRYPLNKKDCRKDFKGRPQTPSSLEV